jgi:excisionase family DNA binding protein
MSDVELLRAPEAARRLGISTKDVLTLAHERRIEYVMRDGKVHFPPDALARYEAASTP